MKFNVVLPEVALLVAFDFFLPSDQKAADIVDLLDKKAALPDIGLALLHDTYAQLACNSGPGESNWPLIYKTGVLRIPDGENLQLLADVEEELSEISRLHVTCKPAQLLLLDKEAFEDRMQKVAMHQDQSNAFLRDRYAELLQFLNAVEANGGRFSTGSGYKTIGSGHKDAYDNLSIKVLEGDLQISGVTGSTRQYLEMINRQLVRRVNDAKDAASRLHNIRVRLEKLQLNEERYFSLRMHELSEMRDTLLKNILIHKEAGENAEQTRYELLRILCTGTAYCRAEGSLLPVLEPANYNPNRWQNCPSAYTAALSIDATNAIKATDAAINAVEAAMTAIQSIGSAVEPVKSVRLKKDGTPWGVRKAKSPAKSASTAPKTPRQGARKGKTSKRSQKPAQKGVRLRKDGKPWGVRKPAKK